jgi:predicted nucleic acid-binding protein
MPSLLDSDWSIDALAQVPDALALIDRLAEGGIAVSVITYMEVYQGVLRSPAPEQARRDLEDFLHEIPVLPLTPSIARRCAGIREALRGQGRAVRMRALDLLIAATALEHQFTLVTRNLGDYNDIPGLDLYREP